MALMGFLMMWLKYCPSQAVSDRFVGVSSSNKAGSKILSVLHGREPSCAAFHPLDY